MSTEPIAATNTPDSPIVQIDRVLFARIEEQTRTVTDTDNRLKAAAEAHKDAKKNHESALLTLQGLVNAMIRRANGEPDGPPLPLFDNQNDAIAAATSDPIVTTLVERMLHHGLANVNTLVVAGYDEAQRAELGRYLDALDARALALSVADEVAARKVDGVEASVEIPPVPELPAFLQPQDEPEISDQQIIEALSARHVELKKKHVRLLSQPQRREVLAWAASVQEVSDRLGEALTFDDLPAAPSYIANPRELEVADTEAADAADAPQEEVAPGPKKARAPRRSSAQFRNSPKMAGTVKKAKGKNRQKAVN